MSAASYQSSRGGSSFAATPTGALECGAISWMDGAPALVEKIWKGLLDMLNKANHCGFGAKTDRLLNKDDQLTGKKPQVHGLKRSAYQRLAKPLTVMMLLLFTGCMSPYERGMEALNDQQIDAAEALATQGLEETPNDPELNLLMARTLAAKDRFEEAEGYARRALRSPHTRAEAGYELGRIQRELGRPIDAAKSWRNARKLKSDAVSDKTYSELLAEAIADAERVDKFEEALIFRLELAELDPNASEASSERIQETRAQAAEELAQKGQFERSVEQYRILLKDQPDNDNHLLALAGHLATLERVDEAMETFEAYIAASEPSSRVARMTQIAERADNPQIAEHFFIAARDLMDKPDIARAQLHFNLARLYYNEGKKTQARESLEAYLEDMRAQQEEPLSGDTWVEAANLASAQEDQSHAMKLLERGLKEAKPHWGLSVSLAELYARRAQNADVERVINAYIEKADSPYQANLVAGRWAQRRRNYELARHFIEHAVEDNSEVGAEVWLELAEIYTELGQTDRLKVALTSYLKVVKPTSENLGRVAAIYQKSRLYADAEKLLKQLLKANPEDLRGLDELANLYAEWERFEQILPYYERWIAARGGQPADYRVVGERLGAHNQPDLALKYIEKAAEGGDHEAWLQIARVFQKQRRAADMNRALTQFVDSADDRLSALRTAQSYYQVPGMEEQEIAVLHQIIELDPDGFSARQRLSELYFGLSRPQEAAQVWAAYLEQTKNPQAALRQIARTFEAGSRAGQAIVVYQRLLKTEKPDPQLFRWLGDAYVALSRSSEHRGKARADAYVLRAKRYYSRFLDDVEISQSELLDFAHAMSNQRLWDVAAQIYETMLQNREASDPLTFNYAEALLKVGRADEARALLKQYASARETNERDARQIGEALLDAELFEDAQPYFEQLLSSKEPAQVDRAFRSLATIYRMTRRPQKIAELAEQYLVAAQNPTRARQAVIDALQNVGMYAEAAHQIERVRQAQGDVMGLQLAESYYYAGDFDQAHQAFEAYAEHNQYVSQAWGIVGEFYENHGEIERANQAYERAVQDADDRADAHAARAIFLLRQGDLAEGQAALETARSKADKEGALKIALVAAQTMREIGRHDLAAEIAEQALRAGDLADDEPFERFIYPYRLATQSGLQARRTVDALQRSSLRLEDKINALIGAGFVDEAADWVEEELVQGDHTAAMGILERRTYLISQKDGLNRLELAVKPLIDRSDEGAIASGQLGHILLRQGEFRRAIPYLKTAADHQFIGVLPLLSSVYQSLGLNDMASQTYQTFLLQSRSDEHEETLRGLGKQQTLFGENKTFLNVLNGLKYDGQLQAESAPLLTEQLLISGQVDRALDTVRDALLDVTEASDLSASSALALTSQLDSAVDGLILHLEILAAQGYITEANELLGQLSAAKNPAFANDLRIQMLQLKLAAHTSPDATDEAAENLLKSLKNTADDAQIRLEAAKILQINGHVDAARDIARQNLKNAAPSVQRQTIEFLLSNAVARGDEKNLETLSEELVEQSSTPLRAAEFVLSRLSQLAQEREALKWAEYLVKLEPTPQRARKFWEKAALAEDLDAQKRAARLLVRLDEEAMNSFNQRLSSWGGALDYRSSRVVLDEVNTRAPASVAARGAKTLAYFRTGQVEAGREELVDWLESLDFEPYATERILTLLAENGFFVESARVVAPLLEGRPITAASHRHLGLALRHIGKTDEAQAHLEQFVEMRPNAAIAMTSIAEDMMQATFHADALQWANRAIEEAPDRMRAYFWRGVARLYDAKDPGELDEAKRDLERSIGVGIDRQFGLYFAAYHALKAHQDSLAESFADALIKTPAIRQPGNNVILAMRAFSDAERSDVAVDYFQEHFPLLLSGVGGGALGLDLVPAASTLYAEAGDHAQAQQLYEDAISQLLIRQPTADEPRVLMNNLAYGYSTAPESSAEQFEHAISLVRRAIAATPERSESYLDTLGWLYFKSGKVAPAERYIRSALSSIPASSSQIGELVDHLADLEDARGYPDQAAWLRVYRQSLAD